MKINFFTIVFLFFTISFLSQNANNKWVISLGIGSALYSEEDTRTLNLNGRLIKQFPRISIARYMFKNVTFAGSASFSYKEQKKYTTIDGEARYDFGTSENRISIYVLLGGSFIDAVNFLPTLNFGGGGALWISDRFGLNGQLIYKFNEERFNNQRSHIFGSVGLVYRFSISSNVNSSSRKRIWNL